MIQDFCFDFCFSYMNWAVTVCGYKLKRSLCVFLYVCLAASLSAYPSPYLSSTCLLHLELPTLSHQFLDPLKQMFCSPFVFSMLLNQETDPGTPRSISASLHFNAMWCSAF